MRLHQILITDSGKIPNNLPLDHYNCMQSIKSRYDNYHLYSGEELENILNDNFDKSVLKSYLKLNAYTYRSDLARTCLLYLYGGLYIDLYILIVNKFNEEFLNNFDFVAFRDIPFTKDESWSSWAVQASFMYSIPKCKIMEKHIELVVENCKHERYNTHPLDISSCLALGKSINKAYLEGQDERKVCIIGDYMNLTYGRQKENFSYVLNDGTIMGFAIKNMKHLNETGIFGTNSYAELYYNRDVYNKNIKI